MKIEKEVKYKLLFLIKQVPIDKGHNIYKVRNISLRLY